MKHALVIRLITLGLLYPASFISIADDTDTAEVDEIIVSATRREESVMEIPQSVQAIPRQTLSMPIYRDVTDVYNLVPGAGLNMRWYHHANTIFGDRRFI